MRTNFLKSIILFSVFFALTPLAIGISLFSLLALDKPTEKAKAPDKLSLYASLPDSMPNVMGVITASDARVELLRAYLQENKSPLAIYTEDIVNASDKYGVDYRLITAIAQKESGLCRVIPEGTHNCWGWGIHKAGTLGFDSYKEGIYEVTKGLKENYIDLGYKTVEEIMSKYIPHSPNGIWAVGVSAYMEEISSF